MPQNDQDLSQITSPDLEERIKTGKASKIILPVGSLEQHGPHLPLNTDTAIGDYVAKRVSEKCPHAFLMPAIPLGCSTEHLGFAGTISLQPETMLRIILEISTSLLQSGIRKLFIINGHGGNRAALEIAMINTKHVLPEMQLYSFTILDIAKERFAQVRKSSKGLVGHADEIETSMMLAIKPEAVDMSKAVLAEPSLPGSLSFEPEDLSMVSFSWNTKDLSKIGVIGDPRHAAAETGRTLLDFTVEKIATMINEL